MKNHESLSPNGFPSFDEARFSNPPSLLYPVYAWVWNAPITKAGIDKRLEDFKQAGIRGIYVLPLPVNFRPQNAKTELNPPYLSKEYFELVRYAYTKAEDMGLALWLYDEGGWPSGGACGEVVKAYPDGMVKRLSRRIVNTDGAYHKGDDAIAAFIGDKRIKDGDDCRENVYEFYISREQPTPNQVNLLDEKTIDTFINLTHEGYKRVLGDKFSASISSMFTDEPFLTMPAWYDGLEGDFREKYGYDLLDRLPYVFNFARCDSEDGIKARCDYVMLIARRFADKFFKKSGKYCEENGLCFIGHLNGEDTLPFIASMGYGGFVYPLSFMQIPGIDVIWRQIYPYKDSSPALNGTTFFPRCAPSAAAINGSALAVSESFSVYGDGLSPDEMRYVVNYQLARGINLFNFMSVSYDEANAREFYMRPSFTPSKPGFTFRRGFFEKVARACSVMQIGRRAADTLLYMPSEDIIAGGAVAEAAIASYNEIGERLEREHIEFDLTDPLVLNSAYVDGDGILHVGNATYSNLILPKAKYIPEKICALADSMVKRSAAIAVCDSESIRVSRRVGDSEDIYFVFNQSTEKTASRIEFPLAKNKFCYVINRDFGEIYQTDSNNLYFNLECGEAVIFMFSDREIAVTDHEEIGKIDVSVPVPTSAILFELDTESGRMTSREVTPSELPCDASAELTLESNYTVDEEFDFARLSLSFSDASFFGEVLIDGASVGTLDTTPIALDIPRAAFSDSGKLTLRFSTTAARAILDKNAELLEKYESNIQPMYNGKTSSFEAEAATLEQLLSIRDVTLTAYKTTK